MTLFSHYYVSIPVKNPVVCCPLIAIKVNWRAANEEHSHQPFEMSLRVRTRIEIIKELKISLT